MENLPAYIYWVFGCTVVAALIIFYKAKQSIKTIFIDTGGLGCYTNKDQPEWILWHP